MVYVTLFLSNPGVFCKVQHKNSWLIKGHYCSDVSVLQNYPQSIKTCSDNPCLCFLLCNLVFCGWRWEGEVLTFEHKAVQLWVSVIPPKCSWGAAVPLSCLFVQEQIHNSIICCKDFTLFLPLWLSVHSLNWEILIPQTILPAFDEDLQSWRGCAKFILLIYHIWRY